MNTGAFRVSGFLEVLGMLLIIAGTVWYIMSLGDRPTSEVATRIALAITVTVLLWILFASGLTVLSPNEARVIQFFGRYVGTVNRVVDRKWLFLAIYTGVCALLIIMFVRLPTGFLPTEDQGAALIQFRLPAGATMVRTQVIQRKVEDYFLKGPEKKNVKTYFTVAGGGHRRAGARMKESRPLCGMEIRRKASFHAKDYVRMPTDSKFRRRW